MAFFAFNRPDVPTLAEETPGRAEQKKEKLNLERLLDRKLSDQVPRTEESGSSRVLRSTVREQVDSLQFLFEYFPQRAMDLCVRLGLNPTNFYESTNLPADVARVMQAEILDILAKERDVLKEGKIQFLEKQVRDLDWPSYEQIVGMAAGKRHRDKMIPTPYGRYIEKRGGTSVSFLSIDVGTGSANSDLGDQVQRATSRIKNKQKKTESSSSLQDFYLDDPSEVVRRAYSLREDMTDTEFNNWLEEHKEEIEKCRPAEVGFLLLLQYREIASPKFTEAAGDEKEEKKSITEAHRDEALKFLNSQIIQFRDQVIEAERMRQIAVGVSRLNNTRRHGKGMIGMRVESGAGWLEEQIRAKEAAGDARVKRTIDAIWREARRDQTRLRETLKNDLIAHLKAEYGDDIDVKLVEKDGKFDLEITRKENTDKKLSVERNEQPLFDWEQRMVCFLEDSNGGDPEAEFADQAMVADYLKVTGRPTMAKRYIEEKVDLLINRDLENVWRWNNERIALFVTALDSALKIGVPHKDFIKRELLNSTIPELIEVMVHKRGLSSSVYGLVIILMRHFPDETKQMMSKYEDGVFSHGVPLTLAEAEGYAPINRSKAIDALIPIMNHDITDWTTLTRWYGDNFLSLVKCWQMVEPRAAEAEINLLPRLIESLKSRDVDYVLESVPEIVECIEAIAPLCTKEQSRNWLHSLGRVLTDLSVRELQLHENDKWRHSRRCIDVALCRLLGGLPRFVLEPRREGGELAEADCVDYLQAIFSVDPEMAITKFEEVFHQISFELKKKLIRDCSWLFVIDTRLADKFPMFVDRENLLAYRPARLKAQDVFTDLSKRREKLSMMADLVEAEKMKAKPIDISNPTEFTKDTLELLNMLNMDIDQKNWTAEQLFSFASKLKDWGRISVPRATKSMAEAITEAFKNRPQFARLEKLGPKQKEKFLRDFRKALRDSMGLPISAGRSERETMGALGSYRGSDYLRRRVETNLVGGDPNIEGQVVMEMSQPLQRFCVTGYYGHCEDATSRFTQFNIIDYINPLRGEMVAVTAKVPEIPTTRPIAIPLPEKSMLLAAIGIGVDGQEINLEVDDPLGLPKLMNVPMWVTSLRLRFGVAAKLPRPDESMTSAKLKKKYEQLPEVNRNILAEDLFLLPVEVKNFIAQTRNRFNPVTVAKAIQNKCREIFQYDFDYAQYSAQLPVNVEARMRFLHGKATVPGKEYAGVCADAAILLCQMLREAGILCGPVNGLLAKNKTITTKEAHAAVWALLPNEKGNLEIFILDGTPSESGVETVDTLDARENGAGELTADRGEMKKCLAMAQGELQDYLEGKLKIYNGRVEELLNMEFLGNPEKENGLVNLYLYLEMLRFSGFVEQGKIKALEEGWKDLDSGFGGVKFDPETIEQAKSGQAIIESFKKTAELLAREWGMTTIEARQTIRELATKITAPEMGIEEKAVVGLLGQYL